MPLTQFANFLAIPIAVFASTFRNELTSLAVNRRFRALSGYFIGQTSTPLFNIFAIIIGFRKELSIPTEPYWTRDIFRRFLRLFLIFGASAVVGGICMLVENTVLRQRLPELDSAAYYMVTRFSDIATFLSTALSFTLFPFTAELAAKGKDTRPLIVKAALAVIVSNAILVAAYWRFGEQLLSVLPHGDKYAAFWWAMPWMVANTTIGMVCGLYTTSEISAFKFGYLKWWIPLDLLYPALLLFVTGHGYFDALLPSAWVRFLSTHNITSLETMLWWMTGINIIRLGGCMIAMLRQKPGCIQ